MSYLTQSLLWDFIGLVVAIIIIGFTYIKWSYQYWKNRNVPFLEPTIPFGNIEKPYNRTVSFGEHVKKLYDETKHKQLKFCGIYILKTPILLITDLDLLRNVMTKDFQHFTDRGMYYDEEADPISAHLFAIGGIKWRNLRTKLTPTFTSGKMKQMFQTLVDCGDVLDRLMTTKYHKSNEPIDIKEVLGCFTTDVIGSCAFGLDCKAFEDENSPFRVYGRKILQQTRLQALKNVIIMNLQNVAHFFSLKITPTDIADFFTKVVTDTVTYREQNNVERKDFLQLLIEMKNKKNLEPTNNSQQQQQQHDGTTLTLNEVIAQSFIFFIAGFETSSTLMTFALYELAKNPEIQEKVRKEIETVLAKHDGKVTYDSINEMKYMGQVLDEALRKYPPVPLITRQCVKDYQIPDTEIIIEKDTKIFIPIYGIQMDPEYYPEPEKFDPERFSEENKQKRHQYAHIPFGEGPRLCIGLRFGLMQSKVGLTTLLCKYKFSINPRTKEPLKMMPSSFVLSTEGGIWLDTTELKR